MRVRLGRLPMLLALLVVLGGLYVGGPSLPEPVGPFIADLRAQYPIPGIDDIDVGDAPLESAAGVEPVDWIPITPTKLTLGDKQNKDALPGKKPIEVPAFSITAHEITVGQYRSHCPKNILGTGCRGWPGREEGQDDSHPVVNVTWKQAQEVCEALGGRLPTEAEWEAAARGAEGLQHPWGDEWVAGAANYCDLNCPSVDQPQKNEDDGWVGTAPVGSFPKGKSKHGVHDLVGNVSEWTQDCWTPDHRARKSWKASGAADCKERVVRGGSHADWYYHQFGWFRTPLRGSTQSWEVGFRCARGEAPR